MSDDLISRKVLLDELSSLRIELNGISWRKEFKKTVKEVLDCVKHIVEDQTTAFDKEKVIEELKEKQSESLNMREDKNTSCTPELKSFWHSRLEAYTLAIEIVEKGGI